MHNELKLPMLLNMKMGVVNAVFFSHQYHTRVMLMAIIYHAWQVYVLPVMVHARPVRCTLYFRDRLLQYQTGVSS